MAQRRVEIAFRAAVAALVVVCAAPATSQDEAGDAQRVIRALGLREGSVLAEIGAGDGALTLSLARHVGSEGRVFTTELGDERVGKLRAAVASAGLAQVEVLDAHAVRTNLPDACCDAIVMRDVYHHLPDPAPMNASLFASLRPGGRLAVLDFGPSGKESDSAAGRARDGQHGVSRESVARELREAGFTGVGTASIAGRRYIVVARRPQG